MQGKESKIQVMETFPIVWISFPISVNFFTKYCFPNLHWIHVEAFEEEYCEFVPVHHQQKSHF